MTTRKALIDIENGKQPLRRVVQTYGKKKASTFKSKHLHQDIFGHDDSDIENQFAKLTIESKKGSKFDAYRSEQLEDEARRNEQDNAPVLLTNPPEVKVDHETKPQSQQDSVYFEKLLDLSSSDSIESFDNFGSKLSKLFNIEKVGEGSFAEVFKITSSSSSAAAALLPNGKEHKKSFIKTSKSSDTTHSTSIAAEGYTSIIKVIPLISSSTPTEVLDRCSSVDSVSHEVNILKQLDPVHGFTRFRGIRLVRGSWPMSFLKAYRDFRKHHRKRAINAPPDQDFDDEQIYALVEMDNAGSEISLIKKPSVFQVWDIFWISVILLANAEECIEFEHRDLHMSNICVKTARSSMVELCTTAKQDDTSQSRNSDPVSSATSRPSEQPKAKLDIEPNLLQTLTQTPENLIGLSDLRVTVIDYTVARARLSTSDVEQSPSKKTTKSKFAATRSSLDGHDDDDDDGHEINDIIFDSMEFTSDPFRSDPDDGIESHLQNLTYKKTRAIAQNHETASLEIGPTRPDKWRAFLPRTNVVWLGYLLRILIHRARGRTGKLHLLKGKTGKGGNAKVVKLLQEQMWTTLLQVSESLNGSDFAEIETETETQASKSARTKTYCEQTEQEESEEEMEPSWSREQLDLLPASSLAVLEMAVQTGWLSTGDIQAFRTKLEDENS